jgi:hypothetical protein
METTDASRPKRREGPGINIRLPRIGGEGAAMNKMDFKKEMKALYQPPSNEVVQVDVPPLNFIMIDGAGDPNTSRLFADAVAALFSLSYTLKFMVKKGPQAVDYGVMPLEGLWWAGDMAAFTAGDKSRWQWTMMIMQPRYVTENMFTAAIAEVAKKKKPAALPPARFEQFLEGPAAQTMHIGPFSEEGPAIRRVHEFIAGLGRRLSGKHHEIYLSDIRKAAPEKWKTVIRQPMA